MPEHLAEKLTDIQDQFMSLHVDSLASEEDEADDLITTLAIKVALRGQNVTIISTDKCFLSLLNQNIRVYDYFNRRYLDQEFVQDKFNVRSEQLLELWTLTGDSTNKIPGVPGIGQVTASDLLKRYGSLSSILKATDLKSAIKEHNGIQLLSEMVELDGNSIKDILFQFKGEVDNFVGIIGGKANGKCTLSVIASDNLVKEKDIHAGNLVRSASKHIQGGGGGQPFFATAGGKNPDGLEAAIAEIEASLG